MTARVFDKLKRVRVIQCSKCQYACLLRDKNSVVYWFAVSAGLVERHAHVIQFNEKSRNARCNNQNYLDWLTHQNQTHMYHRKNERIGKGMTKNALLDYYVDGSVHECSISSALAMEMMQSCIKPLMWLFADMLLHLNAQ